MADETRIVPVMRALSEVDRKIAELAERQHGLVARTQLIRLGLGRRAIGHRLEVGRLQAVHRGTYAVGHRPATIESRIMGAVLLGGPRAVASHHSAGWLLGLLPNCAGLEVTVPCGRTSRAPVRFCEAVLAPDETTARRGIPVTTVPRTLLDLAAVLDRRRLERAIDEAEVRRLTDSLALPDLLERHPRSRGAATLRAILADGRVGAGITRSELEERFLELVCRAGLEPPTLNAPLQLDRRWIEVDCIWPAHGLVVELDGRAVHGTARAFERDRGRDRALQANGWRVVRITWRQLHSDARAVMEDLRRLLAADRYSARAQGRPQPWSSSGPAGAR